MKHWVLLMRCIKRYLNHGIKLHALPELVKMIVIKLKQHFVMRALITISNKTNTLHF